jgi:hypothetical protein
MTEPTDRETTSLTAAGESVRKGIEIVTSQELPAGWKPPTASLGPEPTAGNDQNTSDGSTDE